MSLNNCVFMGNLTRDPELRKTPQGTSVTSFTLAVKRDFGEDGATDFIDFVAWKGTADFVAKHFRKGSRAAVTGKLQIRDWTDKDGNKRRNAEVICDHVYFADSKQTQTDSAPEQAEFEDLEDDENLPF